MPYRKKSNEPKRTPDEQIKLFLEISQVLRESRLFRQGLQTSIEIKWISESGSHTSELKNHDIDDLRSFMTIFRKFTSENSDVFMNKIYNLCSQYLSDEELKKLVADDYETWRDIQNKSEWNEKKISFKVKINGEEFIPKELAEKWMNGFVLHDNVESIKFFEDRSSFELDCIKWSINSYINSSTTHILNFAKAVNEALKYNLFIF